MNYFLPTYKDSEQLLAVGQAGSKNVAAFLADAQRVCDVLTQKKTRAIAVATEDRYHLAATLLGAWQAQCLAVLPPSLKPALIQEIATQEESCEVWSDTPEVSGVDIRKVLGAVTSVNALRPMVGATPLIRVYTSGTTGKPQAFTKTAAQILGEARLLCELFHVTDQDVMLATVPSQHVYGLLFGVLVPLSCGAAFVRETPFYPEIIEELCATFHVSSLASSPAHLQALAELATSDLASVRTIFSSGAKLETVTAELIETRFQKKTTEVLGSTETGGFAYRVSPGASAWTPFPNVTVQADAEGRLLLDSPFAEPCEGGLYRGADQIESLPGGRFRHLGRLDRVIKVGAKRVSLNELETRIRSLPGVHDAALWAQTSRSSRGMDIYAAVVGKGLDAATLRTALGQWFEPSVLPRRIRFVEALPRTAGGKLPIEALKKIF